MGALIKQTLSKLGGRGGGGKDMAQGGVPNAAGIESAIKDAAASVRA
jgi:alanyl-tRNA synthetase